MAESTNAFKTMVSKPENLKHLGGMSDASSEGTTHSVKQKEQVAFSKWINSRFCHDMDLKHLLPIDPKGDHLYEAIKDGILLCKIINLCCPNTIDERAINKKNLTVYTKHENLTLALNSARAIGCNIVNIDAHDLAKGTPHLIVALLTNLFNRYPALRKKSMVSRPENLKHLGGMSDASSEGTTHSVRQEEQIAFCNWINTKLSHDTDLKHLLPLDPNGDHLYEAIKDGILLCKIINLCCPETIDERAIIKKNLTVYTKHENLTLALNSAQAIGCNIVNIDAHDLAKGKPHLIVAFLTNLFNRYPALA